MNKEFITKITNDNKSMTPFESDVYRFVNNIIVTKAKSVNKAIIENLKTIAKENNYDEIYVIDEAAVINLLKCKEALEIIKKKLHINCDDRGKCIELKQDEDQYCDYSIIFCDTQEEYELLKEVVHGN